jgi:endonuclease YncB( thermonuclease family)
MAGNDPNGTTTEAAVSATGLLRYICLEDGALLNAEIISLGYGFAYTKYPFARMEEFRALERKARELHKGLWAEPSQQP